MPWAFLLGRELMWERAYSSRINRWTIGIDAAKAKELMGLLMLLGIFSYLIFVGVGYVGRRWSEQEL
jgi:hypothetical protein